MAAKKAAKKKAAPKAPKAKAAVDQKNGITRPATGTLTRRVWDIADSVKNRADVMAKATAEGIADATVATQYQKWRIYNGITERSPRADAKPKAAKKPKAKAPKAPKSKKAPKAPAAPAANA